MRARVYLIVLGAVMIAASVVVLALNQSLAVEILAALAFGTGLSIIVNAVLDLIETRHDDREG